MCFVKKLEKNQDRNVCTHSLPTRISSDLDMFGTGGEGGCLGGGHYPLPPCVLSLSKPLPSSKKERPPATACRQALKTGFDRLRANRGELAAFMLPRRLPARG